MKNRRYFRIAGNHRKLFLAGIGAGIASGLASGFGVPFFVEHVFRRIFEDSSQQYGLWQLIGVAALLPVVFVVRGVAGYLNQYFLQFGIQRLLQDLRRELFDKLQLLPIAYFERRQSGDLMAKLVGDTLQIQQAVLLVARDAFVQPFTFLAGLGYLIYLSVTQSQAGFLLLLLLMAPLVVLPVNFVGRHLKKRSHELQHTLGELTDIMAENLRGVVEVRSFNLQTRERNRFDQKLDAYTHFAMKMAKYYHMTQPFMELLAVSVVAVAFVYSYQEGVGFSSFAAMGAALFFTVDAVKRLVKMINGLQRATGSFERVETVLTEAETVTDAPDAQDMDAPRGDLSIKHLKFKYSEDASEPHLQIEELEIPHGSVCALVGPSGAGKSTFAKLLPRFYDPQEGSVCFDGVDIRKVRKSDLRRRIAFVPQSPVLFNGTVADNIRLARPEASMELVKEAARRANADTFVEALGNGYETIVGENAIRLSGGQRQRIALARAILKDAPILILDEATSALDAESEVKIQDALKDLAKNRTILIIAHRFATIRLASRVLLFDNGRIRCDGDFPTLMKDALFRRLYELQTTPDAS
jgi:subfamily B ATP-binding cassette protein MsbA